MIVKKKKPFLYLFFMSVLMNISILNAMSLKSCAPIVGPFTVNRPRMFAATCGLVGMHRRFPLSMPSKTGWQMVNESSTDYDRQKFKSIESTIYRWAHEKDRKFDGAGGLWLKEKIELL